MSDKVELEIGVPQTLSFTYRQGKLCEKKWPGAEDCFARATTDGRILFVDADVEARILKAAPKPGMPVVLTLEKTAGGNKYTTVKSAAPQLKAPMGVHTGGKAWHRLKTPAPLPKRCYAQTDGSTITDVLDSAPANDWADVGQPATGARRLDTAAPVPKGAVPQQNTAQTQGNTSDSLLGRCLCEALDACKIAQEHAAKIGVPVVFTSGDIERIGVSVFIERTRNGSVTERKPAGRQYTNGVDRVNGVTQ